MRKDRVKIIIFILAIIILSAVLFYIQFFKVREWRPEVPQPKKKIITPQDNSQPTTTPDAVKNNNQAITILKEINLDVPFQSQAPFGNWAEPYQDACEEASLIMVSHYLRNTGLSKQAMKDEIDRMIAWEMQKWGYQKELTMEEVKIVAVAFYKYKTEIIADLTSEKIKTELSLGRPVIVPAAGRELGNPNYHLPGPIYHMLVIKGYTADGNFITNDPGTRNGADYIYKESVLMSAIHDWSGVNATGPKIGLIMRE